MAGRLALVAVGCSLGFVLAELLVRLVYPQVPCTFKKGMFIADEATGYRLAANWSGWHGQPEFCYTIRTNSWGWRGPEPRPGARHKVLVVGDSYGFGHGVADGQHACDLTRSHLLDRGMDFDLLNACAPGYCLVNYSASLARLLPRYRPELVILLFCANDFGRRQSMRASGGFLLYGEDLRFIALRRWLNRHCQLYLLVKKIHYMGTALRLNAWTLDSYEQADLDFTVNALRNMGELCSRGGARFVVMVTPSGSVFGEPRGWLTALMSRLDAGGVQVCNPAARISGDQIGELLYKADGHWNRAGCELMSGRMVQLIEDELRLVRERARP